jgi:hypothetical protein
MNATIRTLSHGLTLIVAVCFGLLMLPTTAYCDVVLFSDDFEAGNADNWEIVEFGEWEVIDGQYCLLTV